MTGLDFLEHEDGYVKALEKLTFLFSTARGFLNIVTSPTEGIPPHHTEENRYFPSAGQRITP